MSSIAHLRPNWILPAIVVGQVLATSTWFAVNAVAYDLSLLWTSGPSVGRITLMVQLGFIVGTLVVATTGVADWVEGRRLFLISALCAAVSNAAILWAPANYNYVLVCRFATGASLAGVYPVGMRIAASWYAAGLGRALGYLVGALVLGTSLTHLVRGLQLGSNWQAAIIISSLAALAGSGLVSFVPDGPHLKRGGATGPNLCQACRPAFGSRAFRQAAFAYFGHMWELYTFWAFMPRWIQSLEVTASTASLLSFLVIAVGMPGCVLGGLAAERYSSRRVARLFLGISFVCCLLSPLVYGAPAWLLLSYLVVWGIAVVGDSPQLSSLNAQSAPLGSVGSALTFTTCIGFSVTVVSLLVLDWLSGLIDARFLFVPLAIGPLIGWRCLRAFGSAEAQTQLSGPPKS